MVLTGNVFYDGMFLSGIQGETGGFKTMPENNKDIKFSAWIIHELLFCHPPKNTRGLRLEGSFWVKPVHAGDLSDSSKRIPPVENPALFAGNDSG